MRIIGIVYMLIGITLTILNTYDKDIIGILSAVMAFICGLVIVLVN